MALERQVAGIGEPVGNQPVEHRIEADGRQPRVHDRRQQAAPDRVTYALLGAVDAAFLDGADPVIDPGHLAQVLALVGDHVEYALDLGIGCRALQASHGAGFQ
ncbi:hypothetical protein D3C83_19580 [compost metagenome]